MFYMFLNILWIFISMDILLSSEPLTYVISFNNFGIKFFY